MEHEQEHDMDASPTDEKTKDALDTLHDAIHFAMSDDDSVIPNPEWFDVSDWEGGFGRAATAILAALKPEVFFDLHGNTYYTFPGIEESQG